ncbi:hypothetical protein NMG60_11004962, partial [Bertholletia excelsa]
FFHPELKPGQTVWDLVKGQVRQALEEYGCFEALFPKIPLDLRKALFGALKELFDLPLQTKSRSFSPKPYHGYIGQYPHVPLYESMAIYDALLPERSHGFTNLMWPEGNPDFCKTIQAYSELLSELDVITRTMVLESLGLEKYLDEHMESTNYLFRVMKYEGPQARETKLGLISHTDKNIVTILHQNQVEGLEVQTKYGDWISLKPSPDSFIALIGDYFYAWTNGRLHSPYHRVMMTGNEARYSAGLFSIPKAGYIIKAPEELVDEDHPLLFKPFNYAEFLEFYYSEAGQRAQSALKTFCGV